MTIPTRAPNDSASMKGKARHASRRGAPRIQNSRGQGGKLRDEILTTAAAILEEARSPAAITLRAVAREIGIATTSIYSHFPDREAILAAIADRAYTELAAATAAARARHSDPVERLVAGCRAYVDYARDRPHLYTLLFATNALPGAPLGSRTPRETSFRQPGDPGATSFGALVEAIAVCASTGASTSTDPFVDAVAVWVALHGYATLRLSVPAFPWPSEPGAVDGLVLRLARIEPLPSP